MKKNIFIFSSVFLLMFGIKPVSASSFYINTNEVEFTKQQYDYISNLYYDGYQDYMLQNDLDKMIELDLFNHPIVVVENGDITNLNNQNFINGTSITQNGRTTKITKSCSSECLVVLTTTWSVIPTINSYDVIGFRLANASINSINTASIRGNNYSITYQPSEAQQFSNGFGYSVKLGNVSGMKITTSLYTSTTGTVYGSYQHAMSNVSLATSRLYTISSAGYGSVFSFYGNAIFKYDAAGGVSVLL